ncbi:hypothetical protein EYR36_000073 [Pleurotus pulmonarius]|nr:hypothetical protein EYR36_000073 [Pleurotus pulmonarius]
MTNSRASCKIPRSKQESSLPRPTGFEKSSGRNSFTRDDDNLLAKYIAVHNPKRYGRRGNALYKRLVANEELRWSWSQRHPWQSWRSRYTDNADWFDQAISKYQRKKGIAGDDSGASGVKPEAGGRSDAKGKRKKEDDDDVSELVEVKQEKKRQKTIKGDEKPVGAPPTTAANTRVLPAHDTELKVTKKLERQGGKGDARVTTTQTVRRVELGTPLTNASDDMVVEWKQEKKRQKTPPTKVTSNHGLPARDTSPKSKVATKAEGQGKQHEVAVERDAEEQKNATAGGERTEGKRSDVVTQDKPATPPANVAEDDDPLFTPNGKTNEEAEDESEIAGQVVSVDEEKPVQETDSRDGALYPSLDALPSPTLPAQMPGSFANGTSRAAKPKPRKLKRAAEDDPFLSSPASDGEIPAHRARKPPTLSQRAFGGTVYYSSPRRKEDSDEHESDEEMDGHWPPVRAKAAEHPVPQEDPAKEVPVEEVAGTGDSGRRRLSHREVQTDAEITMPVASTSRVTLEETKPTASHQATKRTAESLDLNMVEKRRLKSVDNRRRRMSAMSDSVGTDELSTKNVERLRERFHDGRRHSVTGLATRSNSKDSDLRINSLKRGAHSFTRSPPVVSSPPFIPYKTHVPLSAVPIEERDLINSLGVGAAIVHLAKVHGFGEEVAWNVWNSARSIHHTDSVLQAMRRGAEAEGLKLLEEFIDADETNTSVPSSHPDAEDADDEDGDTYARPDPDERRITAESTPLPRRRRKSLPFEYTPIQPGQELENDWQPPPKSRAATISRLSSSGRRDEALAREQRRASLTSRSFTYTPDLHTSASKTEPSDDIQMMEVTPSLPSRTRTPAFQWTKKHEDVMLRAAFNTEADVVKLESQVGDDRAMRQHFVRLLDILHPTLATA